METFLILYHYYYYHIFTFDFQIIRKEGETRYPRYLRRKKVDSLEEMNELNIKKKGRQGDREQRGWNRKNWMNIVKKIWIKKVKWQKKEGKERADKKIKHYDEKRERERDSLLLSCIMIQQQRGSRKESKISHEYQNFHHDHHIFRREREKKVISKL